MLFLNQVNSQSLSFFAFFTFQQSRNLLASLSLTDSKVSQRQGHQKKSNSANCTNNHDASSYAVWVKSKLCTFVWISTKCMWERNRLFPQGERNKLKVALIICTNMMTDILVTCTVRLLIALGQSV